MKYAGYSIKRLIEETLKEGFKEKPDSHPHSAVREFTKWVNDVAYKLRWISISHSFDTFFLPAYPEEKRKLAEKRREEERNRLESKTEAKRGINWDETIIEYNDKKFDKMLQELQKLRNEVRKKEKEAEKQWKRVKDRIWEKVKEKFKAKHISPKDLREIEAEKDVPVYLHYGIDVRWKDPVCGKKIEETELMQETFYNKYHDFITSIALDTFLGQNRITFKDRFEHSRFIIEGCRSKKQLDKLLKFIKLYKIVFCNEPEPELQRLGRPRKLVEGRWKEAIKYYYDYKLLAAEACRMEKEIRKEYESRTGHTLENIHNTHKSKILNHLNGIIKERDIGNILLRGHKNIEEMIIAGPEDIAVKKVSEKYDIGKDYFRLHRDWKQAPYYHLFDKYKRATLYKKK